ncbi:MAG: hypothetical protein B7X06_00290, partial [Verrucomicrobia bacterium 21-51-4]
MIGIGLVAGSYPFLSRDHQLSLESRALIGLDWLREDLQLPEVAVQGLDFLVDCIPLAYESATHLDIPPPETPWTLISPPASTRRLQYLVNVGYIAGYDNALRNPSWVAYRVFKPDTGIVQPRPKEFRTDRR